MALAYATTGSPLYHSTALLSDLSSALDWMYSNRYNENKILYDNWWDWWIGTPLAINDIAILLYDDLTFQQISNYMLAIDHFTPIVDMTAANRVWKSQVVAYRGIIVKDAAKLAMAKRRTKSGISVCDAERWLLYGRLLHPA